MKRLIALFLIVCLLPGLTACAPNQTEGQVSVQAQITPDYPAPIAFDDYDAVRVNRENNPVSDAQKQAVNHFSYVTASAVLQNINANGCYSPLSPTLPSPWQGRVQTVKPAMRFSTCWALPIRMNCLKHVAISTAASTLTTKLAD